MQNKFRIYEHETDAILVPESVAMTGEGEFIDLGSKDDPDCGDIHPVYWFSDPDEFDVSWHTGWEDANGEEIFEGDLIKRTRDTAAETEKRWMKEDPDAPDVGDIEEFVNDYSESLGVVKQKKGGFVIELIEGHRRAFHGPAGELSIDLGEEAEVVGNIWQTDLSEYGE